MNPPIDAACFQLGVPPDYDDKAEAGEEAAWLRELDSQALQQTLADLQRAFANFFARRG